MIAVLDFGMGNIHSILKALRLFYDDVRFTADVADIRKCRGLVLPGDGHFETAMRNLAGEKEDSIRNHVLQGRPLLGICIGFQLLFDDSSETIARMKSSNKSDERGSVYNDDDPTEKGDVDERMVLKKGVDNEAGGLVAVFTNHQGPLVKGLGLVQGSVRRFRFDDPQIRIPHMGWNRLQPKPSLEKPAFYLSESMYFIHSYRPENTDENNVITTTDYCGDRFASTIQKESILATQYHPEKSDKAGLQFLKDWVKSI